MALTSTAAGASSELAEMGPKPEEAAGEGEETAAEPEAATAAAAVGWGGGGNLLLGGVRAPKTAASRGSSS